MNSPHYVTTLQPVIAELCAFLEIPASSISCYTDSLLNIPVIGITLDITLLPKSLSLDEFVYSLQSLARTITAHRLSLSEDIIMAIISINNSHENLIDILEHEARMIADRTMTFGVPVRMKPQHAFHRKILHSLLQQIPGIHSESYGEGRERHIMVSIKED